MAPDDKMVMLDTRYSRCDRCRQWAQAQLDAAHPVALLDAAFGYERHLTADHGEPVLMAQAWIRLGGRRVPPPDPP